MLKLRIGMIKGKACPRCVTCLNFPYDYKLVKTLNGPEHDGEDDVYVFEEFD